MSAGAPGGGDARSTEDEGVRRRRIKAFLFDMDGVLYRGPRPLPGARKLLRELDRIGIPFALVTNNSTRTPRQYVRHLASMGMHVAAERIVTSAVLTAAHLQKTLRQGSRVLVIGEPALERTVARAGFTPSWERAAAVVVGLDRHLTYRKLRRATEALLDGAAFIAANPDPLLPTPEGAIPGTGAIVTALAYATGRRPLVLGKPRPQLLREAMARIGTSPSEAAMVGDQLTTDIAAGRAAGVFTILVQSGIPATRPTIQGIPRPNLIVRDLRELRRRLAGLLPSTAPQRSSGASR